MLHQLNVYKCIHKEAGYIFHENLHKKKTTADVIRNKYQHTMSETNLFNNLNDQFKAHNQIVGIDVSKPGLRS